MNNNFIYFDHESTSPISGNVLNNMIYSYKNYWGNVSSKYKFAVTCSLELERIRSEIANKFNTNNENIIFTSGSTESIALVFNRISEKYKKGDILISKVEHNATIIASNILKKRGWNVKEIAVNKKGIIEIDSFDSYLKGNVKFASIIWGQSEIGSIQPIQQIGSKLNEMGILYHIDATQILSNGLFDWDQLNCDFLSFSAHKFGGPKGIGILLCRKKSKEILINKDISISQEYSIRAGTQPLALISALNMALSNIKCRISINNKDIIFNNDNVYELRDYLIEKIKDNNHIKITGSLKKRLPNHLSFILFNKNLNPIESYKVVNFMSSNNIAISSGSACSNSKNIKSQILKKIGYKNNLIYSNLRVSFNKDNTKDQVDIFYNLILKCIELF